MKWEIFVAGVILLFGIGTAIAADSSPQVYITVGRTAFIQPSAALGTNAVFVPVSVHITDNALCSNGGEGTATVTITVNETQNYTTSKLKEEGNECVAEENVPVGKAGVVNANIPFKIPVPIYATVAPTGSTQKMRSQTVLLKIVGTNVSIVKHVQNTIPTPPPIKCTQNREPVAQIADIGSCESGPSGWRYRPIGTHCERYAISVCPKDLNYTILVRAIDTNTILEKIPAQGNKTITVSTPLRPELEEVEPCIEVIYEGNAIAKAGTCEPLLPSGNSSGTEGIQGIIIRLPCEPPTTVIPQVTLTDANIESSGEKMPVYVYGTVSTGGVANHAEWVQQFANQNYRVVININGYSKVIPATRFRSADTIPLKMMVLDDVGGQHQVFVNTTVELEKNIDGTWIAIADASFPRERVLIEGNTANILPKKGFQKVEMGCAKFNVVVVPDDANYEVIVENNAGTIIHRFTGRGTETFVVTWPINKKTAEYTRLYPTCAEVLVDGNTVAETGKCMIKNENSVNTGKNPASGNYGWHVVIRSQYPYTYRIDDENIIHLSIYVNYTARTSCNGIYADVEPDRCPNCYKVYVYTYDNQKPGTECAEVIRHIPELNVEIPLMNTTRNVEIQIVNGKEYEPGGYIRGLKCMDVEANVLEIQNKIRSCEYGCTEREKVQIENEISRTRLAAKELNCNVQIPNPEIKVTSGVTGTTPPEHIVTKTPQTENNIVKHNTTGAHKSTSQKPTEPPSIVMTIITSIRAILQNILPPW